MELAKKHNIFYSKPKLNLPPEILNKLEESQKEILVDETETEDNDHSSNQEAEETNCL